MSKEKTVSQAIDYRRSVRVYDPEHPLDTEKVKQCLQQAALAPNSSNMQLWEFIHITDKAMINAIAPLCFNQNAARTADQLVVFVTRKDLWRHRAQANLDMINRLYPDKPKSEQSRRERVIRTYYGKLIPNVYFDFFGLYGWLKYLMVLITGLFRPIYREVRAKDMRVVVHKTCAPGGSELYDQYGRYWLRHLSHGRIGYLARQTPFKITPWCGNQYDCELWHSQA